jgi:hypothetical protein
VLKDLSSRTLAGPATGPRTTAGLRVPKARPLVLLAPVVTVDHGTSVAREVCEVHLRLAREVAKAVHAAYDAKKDYERALRAHQTIGDYAKSALAAARKLERAAMVALEVHRHRAQVQAPARRS